MFKEEIFKAYDIRGRVNADFDKDFASLLGRVLSLYLGANKIIVGRDMRESSSELAQELIRGIQGAGCDVLDIGVVSTPLFYFGVIEEGADGGVMITASHLGEEFNGFKVTKEKAIVMGGTELYKVAKDLFKNEKSDSTKTGALTTKNILDAYIKKSIDLSGLKKGDIKSRVKLIGNELVLGEIKKAAEELDVEIVNDGAEIGFEFDADGDRVVAIDSAGKKIRGDLLGGALAGYFFEGGKVVFDVRYSRGVLEFFEKKRITAIKSRVGHALIKAVMRETDADFCGEQSSHVYFKKAGHVESSILAALMTLKLIKATGKTIEEIIAPVSSWTTTDEINFDLESREKISELLLKAKERYGDGKIDETDGVKVEYPNWGFLLRPSNTEAKLRLIVDAREEALMAEKREELLELLK